MKCCAQCLGDIVLTQTLFNKEKAGECDFCKMQRSNLIDPLVARDYFELLLEVYQPDPSGWQLAEILSTEWNLFPNQDLAHISYLLSEILGDGNRARGLWKAINHGQEEELIQKWEEFRPELVYVNRFFPKADIIPLLETLKPSFGVVSADSGSIATALYRARICESDTIFHSEEMGAPPRGKVGNGRANPNGIPYLYLASDPQTAISEVRPNPSDQVTLAEVSIDEGLRLVDLMSPRKRVSPFLYADAQQIARLRVHLYFMERLSKDLSKPIPPRSASLDYLPTQFISEAIKYFGFDGIIFQSSVADGFNVALFDPSKATIANPTLHRVTQVGFTFECV